MGHLSTPSDSLLEGNKMEEAGVGVTLVYEDDDPDVVIPENIARPLVLSAHLLLVVAIVAAVYHFWILFSVGIFVYITSILHWRHPRFSTIERKLDFLAVATNIVYGSIFAMSLNGIEYKIVWFIGLFVIGIIFITNEVILFLFVVCFTHEHNECMSMLTLDYEFSDIFLYPSEQNCHWGFFR